MINQINVLILGSGGREHAIAWHIQKNNKLKHLYVAPGNAGTAQVATNIHINTANYEEVRHVINNYHIDLLIIGPEDPLVNGLHDKLLADKQISELKIIGPKEKGAQLEGSKLFAKKFMQKYKIPTATFNSFTKSEINQAMEYIKTNSPPFVIKADGLAAGKGVFICKSIQDGIKVVDSIMLQSKFGNAGNKIVIESFLDGIEMSIFILTDGHSYKILPEAKDYKQIGEGNVGLNTGGMGSISPVPFLDEFLMKKIKQKIIEPTLFGLKQDNIQYSGFIFFGLMIVKGDPFVIEYNVRLGDPETQTIIPRIKSNLLDLFWAIDSPEIFKNTNLDISKNSTATVILTSGGYPEQYKQGYYISGTEKVKKSTLFHAGVKLDHNTLITSGGRVLAVTSLENSLKKAIQTSYSSVKEIKFQDMYFRKDIGKDVLK